MTGGLGYGTHNLPLVNRCSWVWLRMSIFDEHGFLSIGSVHLVEKLFYLFVLLGWERGSFSPDAFFDQEFSGLLLERKGEAAPRSLLLDGCRHLVHRVPVG